MSKKTMPAPTADEDLTARLIDSRVRLPPTLVVTLPIGSTLPPDGLRSALLASLRGTWFDGLGVEVVREEDTAERET